MGRKFPTGVTPQKSSIQIWFIWREYSKSKDGRIWETLKLTPTAANIARASRIREEIQSKINLGVMDGREYHKYFPRSKKLAWLGIPNSTNPTFYELAQQWLNSVEVSDATAREYKKALECYWIPQWYDVHFRSIRYSMIKQAISEMKFPSAKTRNNALIPLRGMYRMALEDEIIDTNPMLKIPNLRHQKTPPDPYTTKERDVLLSDLRKNEHIVFWAYFQLAFFAGLRNPSELLGLWWPKVNFVTESVRIDRKLSRGKFVDVTKTAEVRDVRLCNNAMAALKAIKAHSYLSGEQVFCLPEGQIAIAEKWFRHAWDRAHKRTGIRRREMRQTRHTCASQWLMEGLRERFCARQLGHSPVMFATIYSKWINEQGDDAEMAKLNKAREG